MLANHLDKNFDTKDMKRQANRDGFGEGLVEAARRDQRVVALSADLTESTRVLPFFELFPKRFVQVGVAEQNLAGVASGLAALGKIPFISSYAMFSPGRNWEQIRTTIAYNDTNVKIIGAHAGVSVGPDGATHQAIEDIALMRVMPNMVVLAPADVHEARKATLAAALYDGPVYIRLGRSNTPVVTTLESPFTIGKAELMYQAPAARLGLLVTGSLLYQALKAALVLKTEGIAVSVLHVPTIKPLDETAILDLASSVEALITIEEHQISGGLGGAVAELLSEKLPKRLKRLGIHDQFGQSGEPDELFTHYGLDVPALVAAGKKVLTN